MGYLMVITLAPTNTISRMPQPDPRGLIKSSGVLRSRFRVPLWEQGFVVFGLLLSTGAWALVERMRGIVRGIDDDPVRGDPFEQVIWTGIYILSMCLTLLASPACLRWAVRFRLLWLLVFLAVASLIWSDAPVVTAKRCVAVLGSSVFGLYLGTRYTSTQLFRLLLWVAAISALCSVGIALLAPAYGIADDGWRGVYGQKNWLGRMMAFAIVLWLLAMMGTARYRLVKLGFAGLSTALLLLSDSKGALVVLLTLLALFPIVRLWRLHLGMVVPLIMIMVTLAGIGGTVVAGNLETVLGLVGKDQSFTGRVPLWEAVWEMIGQHPWLGFGYGAFWLGWNEPSQYVWIRFARVGGWEPPNAHNGFLDLWLELGIVGLSLFVIVFCASVSRALVLIRREQSMVAAFPFMFLIFLLLSNLTESNLVTHNSIFWILFVAMSLQLNMPERKSNQHGPAVITSSVSAQFGQRRSTPSRRERRSRSGR